MNDIEGKKTVVDPSICIVPTFSCFTLCDDCILHCRMCEKWKPDIYIKPERKQLELEDWKKCAVSLRKIVPDDFLPSNSTKWLAVGNCPCGRKIA